MSCGEMSCGEMSYGEKRAKKRDDKLRRCLRLYLRGHSMVDIGIITGSDPGTVRAKLLCAQRKVDAGLLHVPREPEFVLQRFDG